LFRPVAAPNREFWSDPDYLPLKKLREGNTEGDCITFPGGFNPA